MLSVLPGVIIVLGIAIVAGVIAYIGDRVGHQVGRKRMTLFGLRPKYTSTIVAIATGMLIAISVTLVALAASGYVRTAFFQLGALNAQLADLRKQAADANAEINTTRNANLALPVGAVVAQSISIDTTQPQDVQLRALGDIFDETVKYVNKAYTVAPYNLKPMRERSTDADVRTKLASQLQLNLSEEDARGLRGTPILYIPVIPANIFRGELLTFSFAAAIDTLIASANDQLASIDVEGGSPISPVTVQDLGRRAVTELVNRGFPPPLISTGIAFDPARLEQASNDLARSRGRYQLVVRTEQDVFPHTGGAQFSVSVEPIKK